METFEKQIQKQEQGEDYQELINKIENDVRLSRKEKDRVINALKVAERIKNKS